MARVPEKGLVELVGTMKLVFLHVTAQKLNSVSHQRPSAHFAPFSQKADLRGWFQTHVSGGKIGQLLNTRSRVVKDTQQNRISSTGWGFGGQAAPRSQPTLPWKGRQRLDEHVTAGGLRGFFDTDAYGLALPPEDIGRTRARPQGGDYVSGVKTFFLVPSSPRMPPRAKHRFVRGVVSPERFPVPRGRTLRYALTCSG